ncbi:hypothetical protein EVAR_16966_1 [Eumeta japonica]|uniref:Uncharacterized protein n=1 Tax=Eumeta variegata TaxID=151549 RepID=A0A4C1TVJ5_EUMVA|nr:hypothetical protein EVAR_16966_1 [Eumeta japonica]
MRSRQVEGDIRLDRLVLDEGGRETQLKLHTQPTAGGRTLVDADRIKAARIGDPLGVDLTERACRPLIRLSRIRRQRAASFNLFALSSVAMSIRCLRQDTRGRARHRACAQRRVAGAPACGVVVEEGEAGGTAQATHASASRCPLFLALALVRVVIPIGEGPSETSLHN